MDTLLPPTGTAIGGWRDARHRHRVASSHQFGLCVESPSGRCCLPAHQLEGDSDSRGGGVGSPSPTPGSSATPPHRPPPRRDHPLVIAGESTACPLPPSVGRPRVRTEPRPRVGVPSPNQKAPPLNGQRLVASPAPRLIPRLPPLNALSVWARGGARAFLPPVCASTPAATLGRHNNLHSHTHTTTPPHTTTIPLGGGEAVQKYAWGVAATARSSSCHTQCPRWWVARRANRLEASLPRGAAVEGGRGGGWSL